MIKDRVQITDSGFSLLEDPNEKRIPKFGFYTFKEAPDVVPELTEMRYWNPAESYEVPVQGSGCFVYVCEMVGEEQVEDYTFYWSRSKAKPKLEISVTPGNAGFGKGYGPNSYVITIAWPDTAGEEINNEYIFLRSNRGETFQFRRKLIRPKEGGKRPEAKFIYIVPETDDPANYRVDVLPKLKEKYNVIMG